MNAYSHMDVTAIAEQYQSRALTPVEVCKECLNSCRAVPNACISFMEETAVREAEASFHHWMYREPMSMLDGIPLVWKDLFRIRGTVTTAGSKMTPDTVPDKEDSVLVSRARRMGFIGLCKTNMTELAFSVMGTNPHYGTPVNPCFSGAPRVPGGSSCGSAVLVASGAVPLAVGTDTGGSVRVPASYNGIVGFHASTTRYARKGMIPLSPTLDSVGFFSRSVRDIVMVDGILAESRSVIPPLRLNDVKFFVDTSVLDDDAVHPAVKQCVLDTADRLESAGAKVRKGECRAFRQAIDGIEARGWLGGVEASLEYADRLNGPLRESTDPLVVRRLEACAAVGRNAVIRLYQLRERLRVQIAEDLRDAVLLTPSTPHTAPLLSDVMRSEDDFFRINAQAFRYTSPGNLMDMPGISLPAGTDESGLPIGIQLSLPFGEDGRLLAAAQAAEGVIAGR